MQRIRRHLSYANVVATLALLFAMSGGALAARHYLINSTGQINPKVLKKLKGNAGRTGPQGTSGATGPRGPTGPAGATGPAGQVPFTLPSGQSESGEYGIDLFGGSATEEVDDAVTFPIPLELKAPPEQVIYTKFNVPVTHCPGLGHADRGFVCIYSFTSSHVDPPQILNAEEGRAEMGTGRWGFVLQWKLTAADPIDLGSYTVTAG